MDKVHFISGLPRSGSTMLSAILAQNPAFKTSGVSSPVAPILRAVEDATAIHHEAAMFIAEDQRHAMLRGIFESYYGDAAIVFDTSRMWCARLPLLVKLFPGAKIIACVREIGWIMDSFEKLYRANGQMPSAIYGWDTAGTVFSRVSSLGASSGVVGYALDAIREAHASEEAGSLLLVDYECLCKNPARELARIYQFIGEPLFEHDFVNLNYEAGEFDRKLGAKGLHTVNSKVEWTPRPTILPQGLFDRFANDNFWRQGAS